MLILLNTGMSIAQKEHTNNQVDCAQYWQKQDSLNSIKLDYFKNEILNPAQNSKSIPKSNIAFLEELYKYLNLSRIERESTLTLQRPIFPVFRLEEGYLGIFSFPKYHCYKNEQGYTNCDNISAEKKALLSNTTEQNKLVDNPKARLISNTAAFEEIVSSKNVRVFTSSTSYHDQVTQLFSYEDECLEYYLYQLEKQSAEVPLFATVFDLKLVFNSNTEIDKIVENQYADGCYDCSFEYEPVKTFATLDGVDNIYFTYTDTFPLNNKLNYPERAIRMMLNDGTVVVLWSESIDLFGCGCL